jgi:hypothetical protein
MKYSQSVNVVVSAAPSGPLTFTTWAAIPRVNSFVEIANTKMDQLLPQIGPQFRERGSAAGFSAAMAAWCGAALRGSQFIMLRLGGHNDSCNNAGFCFDATAMQWSLLFQPSDYSDAVWNECNQLYIAAGIDPATLNCNRAFPGLGDLVWKDGKLVSTHSYGTIVDAGVHGVFHLRDATRTFDPVTWQHTKLAESAGGAQVPSDAFAFYCVAKDRVYLCGDINFAYGAIFEIDPVTGNSVRSPLGIDQWAGVEVCEIEGTIQMFHVSRGSRPNPTTNAPEWLSSFIDFAAGTQQWFVQTADPFAADGLLAVAQSNKTGVIALRKSGRLSKMDSTGKFVDWVDSGIPQSALTKLGMTNGTWGRLRLVQDDANNQGFVLLADHDENVRVMAL